MIRIHVRRKRPIDPQKTVAGTLRYLEVQSYQPLEKRFSRRWLLFPLLLSLLLTVFVYPFIFGRTATIRLTPATMSREQLISVVASSHPSTTAQSQIKHVHVTQTTRVPVSATGIQMQPATQARGTLLWYNVYPVEQVVAAHTRIVISSTLQLETNETLTIPAAAFPTSGHASSLVHVIQAGTEGNIPAHTLVNHLCDCGQGISVTNPDPFAGGQDSTPMNVLLQHDVDTAIARWQDRLAQQAKSQIHEQDTPQEHVLETTCSAQGSPEQHTVGSVLPLHSQVHVMVSVMCTGLAYNQEDIQKKALAVFQQTRPEGPYSLHAPHIQIVNVAVESQDAVRIAVHTYGTWIYQISPLEKQRLVKGLAGRSAQDAQQYLQQFPGLQQTHLECRWIWLPNDPKQISVLEA